jgi:hypothetical protein
VLFADLVGFTGRAETLDPEDVRALLSPYYTRLRSELERFRGTVESSMACSWERRPTGRRRSRSSTGGGLPGDREGQVRSDSRLGSRRAAVAARRRHRAPHGRAAPRTPRRGRVAHRRARAGAPRADVPARDARRCLGHREEPPRPLAAPRGRRRRGADLLAPGPLPAVRRGRQLLGVRSLRRRSRLRSPSAARSSGSCRSSVRCSASPTSATGADSGRRRPSSAGAGTSRRSPWRGRSSSSSRTSTGPTTGCSTSSTTSWTGRPRFPCSRSARHGLSCLPAGPAGAGGRRRLSPSPRGAPATSTCRRMPVPASRSSPL